MYFWRFLGLPSSVKSRKCSNCLFWVRISSYIFTDWMKVYHVLNRCYMISKSEVESIILSYWECHLWKIDVTGVLWITCEEFGLPCPFIVCVLYLWQNERWLWVCVHGVWKCLHFCYSYFTLKKKKNKIYEIE